MSIHILNNSQIESYQNLEQVSFLYVKKMRTAASILCFVFLVFPNDTGKYNNIYNTIILIASIIKIYLFPIRNS